MKYTNIGKFKRLNDFIDYKMNLLTAGERTMFGLYKLMFSERDNVLFEESDGLIIKKTTYGEAYDAAEVRAGGLKRTINAVKQDVPIIPVYTNGEYFHGKKAKVVIGKPIDVKELYDDSKSEKENLAYISERLRQKVIDLGGLINGK